jgi:hypothetical protein
LLHCNKHASIVGQVEHMLDTEDYGKDLATVQNLSKKHALLEADVRAHDDRIADLNNQADSFIESGLWDVEGIKVSKKHVSFPVSLATQKSAILDVCWARSR